MGNKKKYTSPNELFPMVEKVLADGQQALFTVTGMSMWPFICHNRDQVILQSPKCRKLKKTDIVLYQTKFGKYLLHRIIKVTDHGFLIAGDGNTFLDGEITKDCIKGVVVTIVRKGQKIQCDTIRWRMISILWIQLFPIRKYVLNILYFLSRCKRMIQKVWMKKDNRDTP